MDEKMNLKLLNSLGLLINVEGLVCPVHRGTFWIDPAGRCHRT